MLVSLFAKFNEKKLIFVPILHAGKDNLARRFLVWRALLFNKFLFFPLFENPDIMEILVIIKNNVRTLASRS